VIDGFPARIDHPSAWKGSDFARGVDDVAVDLDERHRDAMRAVVRRAAIAGVGLQQLTHEHTRMDAIADDLADIRREIVDGRGLVIVRGWPVEEMTPEELGIVYWSVGTHFGRGVNQSPMGDRLGYVTDVSKPGERERAYRTAQELTLHTDAEDIVSLLCLRKAKAGGLSRLASSLAIYNEIAAARPDLLPILARGFAYHWFSEQPPGEPPVTPYRVPIFSIEQGKLSCVYLREWIHMAADETGVPLTAQENEALDLFQKTGDRDDLCFTFQLEPGAASFINNYTVLHSRTGFQDWPEPARKRLLLRLWLKAEPSRPRHELVRRYTGDDGSYVDGRQSTVYQPKRAGAV